MLLIKDSPITAPAEAERLVASLWQLSVGAALGLYIIGMAGEEPMLGVHSSREDVEEAAADLVAGEVEGRVLYGGHIPELILSQREVSALRMIPSSRNLRDHSSTWGWQKVDPLKATYNLLARLDARTFGGQRMVYGKGSIAGIGMVFRSLPDLNCLSCITAFASGQDAKYTASKVAASYAGVGIKLRSPIMPRKAVERCLSARMGRPWVTIRADEASIFWHPRFEEKVA
jgi:hypothetical protein